MEDRSVKGGAVGVKSSVGVIYNPGQGRSYPEKIHCQDNPRGCRVFLATITDQNYTIITIINILIMITNINIMETVFVVINIVMVMFM